MLKLLFHSFFATLSVCAALLAAELLIIWLGSFVSCSFMLAMDVQPLGNEGPRGAFSLDPERTGSL